jgi:1,4-dihydroxy-2-naphthoyl-CoA hydrolase
LGTQVSGNHTGVLIKGKALAEAKIIHQGNKTHIWNVDVKNEEERLISTVRVTNMIVKRND